QHLLARGHGQGCLRVSQTGLGAGKGGIFAGGVLVKVSSEEEPTKISSKCLLFCFASHQNNA
ncbi:hypothetical protein, partial [Streptococcus pluranimalium]